MRSLDAPPTGRTRAAALAKLSAAVEALAAELESMPEPALTGGEWGAREVLCHLVYWHETYVSIVRALNERRTPQVLVGTFPQFNRRSVEELGSVPVPELVRRFRLAQRRLAVELLSLRPTARIRIKAGSMARGPVDFANRIAGHIRGHLGDVRRSQRARILPG